MVLRAALAAALFFIETAAVLNTSNRKDYPYRLA